eukprot:scaffold212532_cov18-Tisochrysis_lutea.AAC.1
MATGVFRPAQYLQATQFFSSLGLSHFPLITGPTMGWRCRAKLAVRGEAGRPIIVNAAARDGAVRRGHWTRTAEASVVLYGKRQCR